MTFRTLSALGLGLALALASAPAAAQLGPRFVTGEIVGIGGANSAATVTLPGKGLPGIATTAPLVPPRPSGAVVSADDVVSAAIQIPYANEFRQTLMQTETVFPGQPNLISVRTTFTGGNGKGTLCLACGPVGKAGGPIVGLNQRASGAPVPGGTTAATQVTFTYGGGSTAMFTRPAMGSRATSLNTVSVTPNKALGFGGSVRVVNFYKQEVDFLLSGQLHAAATPGFATGLDFGNGPGLPSPGHRRVRVHWRTNRSDAAGARPAHQGHVQADEQPKPPAGRYRMDHRRHPQPGRCAPCSQGLHRRISLCRLCRADALSPE